MDVALSWKLRDIAWLLRGSIVLRLITGTLLRGNYEICLAVTGVYVLRLITGTLLRTLCSSRVYPMIAT